MYAVFDGIVVLVVDVDLLYFCVFSRCWCCSGVVAVDFVVFSVDFVFKLLLSLI